MLLANSLVPQETVLQSSILRIGRRLSRRRATSCTSSRGFNRRGGFTYIELLVACLILSIGAVGVLASLGVLSRTPANKRLTEMAVYIGSQEMERLKARTYNLLPISTAANQASGVDWYDHNGVWLASGNTQPSTAVYRANWSLPFPSPSGAGGVNRDGLPDSEDLIEIIVTVTDTGGTRTYETARTLLTFGGE